MKTIFLDMDGVVADWQSRVREILGHELPEGEQWADEDWRGLVQFQRLYSELSLMPDARYLVRQVQDLAIQHNYIVKFLTAVPQRNDFPWAFQDKVHWANRHWPEIPVWFGPYSRDKQLRSAPGQVLIDDRTSNIQEWRERGGHGILYRPDLTREVLEDLANFLRSNDR
jgi:sulfur relay (sulfurtransferase) DsrC/TusE family protein